MSQDLKRTLSLTDAVSIVAGSMIGCGIFIVSADIARQVNSGLLLIVIWMIAGFIHYAVVCLFVSLQQTSQKKVDNMYI